MAYRNTDDRSLVRCQIDTVKFRIKKFQALMMSIPARFDLKMDSGEKEIVAKAAALMGTTMAGFVRSAVKEKAQNLLERESRLTLSARDFLGFSKALNTAFAPNAPLKSALNQARRKVQRV
jgi:uncharacterized protein (DUF1778 family)